MPSGGFLAHTLLSLVKRLDSEATPVHRLGRGTSGLVLCARTAHARSGLAAAWRRGEVSRSYRALVSGSPDEDEFCVAAPIGVVPHAILGTIHAASLSGKAARSVMKVLERRGASSVLQVSIGTGRPHQIRIHAAACGHPLVGDPVYAVGGAPAEGSSALPGEGGYFLHAERLGFIHPATGSPIEIACPAPPPLRLRAEAATPPTDGGISG